MIWNHGTVLALAGAVALQLGSLAVCQEKAGGETTAADSFAKVYAEWSDVDRKINEVVEKYRATGRTEREQLLKQYHELTQQSRKMIPPLRTAALAAYRAAPNENRDVTKTLIGLIANDNRDDQYESATELARLLVENKCKESAVYALAGAAAYCLDDFAAAEKYFQQAKEANVLTGDARVHMRDVEAAKQLWEDEGKIRRAEADADDLPRVKLETTKGVIMVELFENEAPRTVGNFVSLVDKKFYDGLTFHRVLPGFMAQGGCPDGTGSGGPGYKIYCECYKDDHRKHFRGSLSMAHAGRDSGGSQFFLTFHRTPHLDGRHTVFGRVIEGLEVLAQLQRRDPGQRGELPEPDKIVKAEVVRKRDHKYEPAKVDKED